MQQELTFSAESFLINAYVLGSFHQGDKCFGEIANSMWMNGINCIMLVSY